MDKAAKILFISAPVGSGHIRAAQAVERACKEIRPDIETRLVNVFDFFNPTLGKWILQFYLSLLRMFPQAYGMAYELGNKNRAALWGRKLISKYLAGRMQNYIGDYQPSVIVCTHATPAGLVAFLLQQGIIHIPVIGIVTDFTIHKLWLYPEITWYYTAHENMVRMPGSSSDTPLPVRVSGIPVMPEFSQNLDDKNVVRQQLGLNPLKPTVLIMGGGAGIMPLDAVIQCCYEMEADIQCIAVAGHNQTMYHKLAELNRKMDKPFLLYGFTSNIHKLMLAADLLISKPGGVSSAEALALGIPLLIYQPLPGVERLNTEFLLREGAAICAESPAGLKALLQQVLYNPEYREQLRQAAKQAGKPCAAQNIATDIIQMTDNNGGHPHG